jgi:hypothetical protein
MATEEDSSTRSVLAELKKLGATEHQDVLFACGGSVTPVQPVRVHFSVKPKLDNEDDGKTNEDAVQVSLSSPSFVDVIEFPLDAELDTATMERLVEACSPATFGKGHETVLDANYRSAFMLTAERWMTNLQLTEYPIMSEVHALLAPDAVSIRAHPHKLNIYKEGGFFKPHTDTPRDGNTFGTLVVCLPSGFSGGDFEVQHNGVKHVFGWGSMVSKSGVDADADTTTVSETKAADSTDASVKWCAFYADCSHEVQKVTTGVRVTITYLLENDSEIPRAVVSATKSNPFVVKLSELLRMKDSELKDVGCLGFALEHKYTVASDGMVPMLKGFDRFLKASLDTLGLEYKFAPVFLAEACEDYLWERLVGKEGPSVENASHYEAYVTSWSTVTSMGEEDEDGPEYNRNYLRDNVLESSLVEDLLWVVPPKTVPIQYHTAAHGNEASVHSYYAAAAFLVALQHVGM